MHHIHAGIDKYDCEGRLITAEYDNFYFLTSCKWLACGPFPDPISVNIITLYPAQATSSDLW